MSMSRRNCTNVRMMAMLTRALPIARPFPKRTMQSIQRRPRTSYSSATARPAVQNTREREPREKAETQ